MKAIILGLALGLAQMSFGQSQSVKIVAKEKVQPIFIYAVNSWDGMPIVSINTIEEWNRNRCLTDYYTADQSKMLKPFLTELGLVETMESTYEPAKSISFKKLRRKLKKAERKFKFIKYDREFEKFMNIRE